jgi:hypothetical protein
VARELLSKTQAAVPDNAMVAPQTILQPFVRFHLPSPLRKRKRKRKRRRGTF